jgi:integrase
MTVIKRGNSYWIDFGFNSHRIRKRSPDNSYKGAQAYELLLRQRMARGQPLEEEKIEKNECTFKELALQWLDIYVKNNNKPSEYQNKKNILNSDLIPYFGTKYIDKITSFSIEQYKNNLIKVKNLSPKSINNKLCVLSKCLKSAQEWEFINIVPKIKLQKVPPQKYDYLTEEESIKLLINAKGVVQEMILLAIKTGLRFGELIALRWEDINIEERILTVNRNIVRKIEVSPKSNRTRAIPLTNDIIYLLKNKNKNKNGKYLFHDRQGNPLMYNYCLRNLHKICKKAELRKIGWHCLRHSFASHLASKNNSIVAIKELLGHTDIKTTMRYSHVNLPVLMEAIESLNPILSFNGTIASQSSDRDSEFGTVLLAKHQNYLGKPNKLYEYYNK